MFHHQTHPRNVHPYQTTVVPRTDAQFHHSNQQRTKYPWLENPPFHPQDCQSTNSSNSETYQVRYIYNYYYYYYNYYNYYKFLHISNLIYYICLIFIAFHHRSLITPILETNGLPEVTQMVYLHLYIICHTLTTLDYHHRLFLDIQNRIK